MNKLRIGIVLVASCIFSGCDDNIGSDDTTDGSGDDLVDATIAVSVSDALSSKQSSHEALTDYEWDESGVVSVTLTGAAIEVVPATGIVSGTTFTITTGGTYRIAGTLSDGNIIVNAPDDQLVRLVLNGVQISASKTAPLYIASGGKAVVILVANTVNRLQDGSIYQYASSDIDEPGAALYSATDLTISGKGSLIVEGNYNDGISTNDGLVIRDASVSVTAVDDGIRGKDYVILADAGIVINARGDGVKSDHDEDGSRGYVLVQGGLYDVTSGGDGLTGATDLLVDGGDLSLVSGGGSTQTTTVSSKALKAGVNLIVEDATFELDAADDAMHSAKNLVINSGEFLISTGDDGVHADEILGIHGGEMAIARSYEGIEAPAIQVTGGTIHLTASDDGLNVSGEGEGNLPPGGGSASADQYFLFEGGFLYIDAHGDGIDINGSVKMSGGVLVVNGPTANMNGPIDYDGSFTITGGLVVAVGSSGMAQAPGGTSTQCSLLMNFTSAQATGTLIHIETNDGASLLTFKPSRQFQSLAYSSPDLVKGNSYKLYLGGSASGPVTDGFYDGEYSPGTLVNSFTVSSITTKINAR